MPLPVPRPAAATAACGTAVFIVLVCDASASHCGRGCKERQRLLLPLQGDSHRSVPETVTSELI